MPLIGAGRAHICTWSAQICTRFRANKALAPPDSGGARALAVSKADQSGAEMPVRGPLRRELPGVEGFILVIR